MRVEPNEYMLVAAHGWDVAGAKWAGVSRLYRAGGQHTSFYWRQSRTWTSQT